MGLIIQNKKFVIITEEITLNSVMVCLDLSKDFDNDIKNEIDIIMQCNKFLAEHAIENTIKQLLSKYNRRNEINEHRKQ